MTRAAAAVVCVALLAACTVSADRGSRSTRDPGATPSATRDPDAIVDARPNALIIVSDEAGAPIDAMPAMRRFFLEGGTTFANAFAASCCPSHPSVLTGRYAHNYEALAGQRDDAIDERTTLQYYFGQETDYRTGLVGRYGESWRLAQDPPFFDEWASYPGYGRRFNVDGRVTQVGESPLDFMARSAAGFIRRAERQDERPWFLYVGAGTADKLVATIARTLSETEETRTTLAFYTSRRTLPDRDVVLKSLEGTASPAIPLAVRWPGYFDAGVTEDALVADVDIAPTIIDAAGLIVDERYPLDGLILGSEQRAELYLEQVGAPRSGLPGWRALRTGRFHYVEHYRPGTDRVLEREYYDLSADPQQRNNLLGDKNASNDPEVRALAELIDVLARCGGAECS